MKSLFMTKKDMPYEGCMLPAGSIIEVEIGGPGEWGFCGNFRFGPKKGDVITFTDIQNSLFMINDYVEQMKVAVNTNQPELALSVGSKMLERIRYQCPEILDHPPIGEKFECPPLITEVEARFEDVE